MASYYVWSGATGSANGTSWANAFTTLTTAFATEVAGDTLYVAHDHSESTGGAVALTSSGVTGTMTRILCVNRSGSVPPVSADRRTTAQVATTTNFAITFSGTAHYDGVIFVAGNSTGAANIILAGNTRFDNCSLRIGSTGNGRIDIGNGGSASAYVVLFNTTASFSAVGQIISMCSTLKWYNTASALIGTAVPTFLFVPAFHCGGALECIGVDFSAAGSGKTLCHFVNTATSVRFRLLDCKLNASVTKSASFSDPNAVETDFLRSGSAGVNYTISRYRAEGTLTEETTIVRTGGASDGTTPIAWKVVTNSLSNFSMPYECPPIAIWNDTTGSAKTATVECIWGGGAVPNDDEIWIDVEYLGDASSPQGSFVNDGKADLLAAAAGQTSSSETWGGSTAAFKLAVTFTAQQAGWIYARARIGKASATIYIDPMVTLS